MKKATEKEILENCDRELKMWRQRYVDHELFHDSKEENWFTQHLMSQPAGIKDIDEWAEFMLKGYRKTKRENS